MNSDVWASNYEQGLAVEKDKICFDKQEIKKKLAIDIQIDVVFRVNHIPVE